MTRLSSVAKIDPQQIRFKISPHHDLRGSVGGDWDLARRHRLADAVKYRSIRQRYTDGYPWEETDLFKDAYARRIERESIRGCATIKDLLAQYYCRVDGMFEDLKRHGFRTDCPLPNLLIGRRREVFIGNQGNHRLAMAQVIGLEKITGEILCRHSLIQT